MKSKISFFNKTIYLKNITLYWPIWGFYLLFLLITGPAMLWLCLREEALYPSTYHAAAQLDLLHEFTNMNAVIALSMVMALLTAMALFNYLSVSKSANMIHALPVSRIELFGTNVLSGITFMFVPLIITFMLDVLICLAYGASGVEYLAMWLLCSMGVSFFFFSIAVFCNFLTGLSFSVPCYYLIIIFLYDIVRVAVGIVVDFIGYGIDFSTMFEYMDATWLSPAHYLWDNLCMEPVYENVTVQGEVEYYCSSLVLNGGKAVALYLIPAVILLVLSYVLYKKRHIETAGDLITVPWLKPIVRWGVGVFAGYFFGIGICSILSEFTMEESVVGVFFAILIVGVICYFIADMCIQKSFKVFHKKNWIQCGCFAGFMLLTFLGINFSIRSIEQYVPEKDEISYMSVSIDYSMDMDDEEMDAVIALHQEIVDHIEEYRKINWMTYEEASSWVNFTYYMKDGTKVNRCYEIPMNGTLENLYAEVYKYQQKPEHYLDYLFGAPYEESVVVDGYMDYYGFQQNGEDDYGERPLTLLEAQKIYDAVVKDAMNGDLQKYNQPDLFYDNYYEVGVTTETITEEASTDNYQIWISLSVHNNRQAEKNTYYYEWLDYMDEDVITDSAYICVGEDCKNLIQALIDIGFIESESDLANYTP